MYSPSTIKTFKTLTVIAAFTALLFMVGHRFSDAPWTEHGDMARIVMFISVLTMFALNRLGDDEKAT